jgi:hypothetical protein
VTGRTCGTISKEGKCCTKFVGKLEGMGHFEVLGLAVRTVLKWILVWQRGLKDLAENTDKWRAAVRTVMFHKLQEIS